MGYQVFLRIIRCIKLNGLNFRMWFKYGLKAQKLLAQGVWGKLGEVLFLFLLQFTLLNQMIQSHDLGILLFK